MTKPRLPPVWLVLLPALALAAVGVRAVTAEMRASQDAARDRARSVASRLARSVDALISEYAGPLPAPGTSLTADGARAAVEHLDPAVVFRLPHMDVLVENGRTFTTSMRSERGAPFPFRDPKLEALVRDALETARRLAEHREGAPAAAALLTAMAATISNIDSRLPLRLAEARYEIDAGDRGAALATLARTSEEGVDVPSEFDGTRFPEAVFILAMDVVGSGDPPAWLAPTCERYLRNPTLVDESVLDRVERFLPPSSATRIRALRRLGSTARGLANSADSNSISTIVATSDGGRLDVSLWRAVSVVGDGWTLLGGTIPQSVVDDRLAHEAAALAREPDVVTVRLAAVGGEHAFDSAGATSRAKDLVVESVPLAGALSGWRAEAVVAPETGVPATAWLLGAALVATTAALLAGTIALRRAAERSSRLAEDRQTFLDHVAHELRTPAAAVQALTEELASGHVPREREHVYREHLLRESRRLSNLVVDTLDFTRLDAGRLAFKMEPADLRDVVRVAIEESADAGRVVATLPDEPVVRTVDAGALRRAVKNLVENAVRHGGGDAPVAVTLEARNGTASIVVADRGRGIAAEHLPRLFERFYRVPSATHETKGVGLGLALCREVARAHGGDVEVASRVGKGSTFTIRMPTA